MTLITPLVFSIMLYRRLNFMENDSTLRDLAWEEEMRRIDTSVETLNDSPLPTEIINRVYEDVLDGAVAVVIVGAVIIWYLKPKFEGFLLAHYKLIDYAGVTLNRLIEAIERLEEHIKNRD